MTNHKPVSSGLFYFYSMKYYIAASMLLVLGCSGTKSYKESILQHRQEYKEAFMTDEQSPLHGNDTAYLRFYEPDETYRVKCDFTVTPYARPFDMPTHSGKTKKFRQYGLVTFKIHDTVCNLQVYQNLGLLKDPAYKNLLFMPFTDSTTYIETYGGGRYLDLSLEDINHNTLVIDFNTCYNPYCAYADGYSCPIPPVENRLPVAIKAGEKNWAKEVQ